MEIIETQPGQEKRRIIIEEKPGEEAGAGTFYQLRHGDTDRRVAILSLAPGYQLPPETTGGVVI